MSKNYSLPERVARLEERNTFTARRLDEFLKRFDVIYNIISEKLDIINGEQAQTRDTLKTIQANVAANAAAAVATAASAATANNELKKLIKREVAAPMTSGQRATVYIALITSISSLVGTIIVAALTYLH